MKKIILGMAIACLATFAEAASCSWTSYAYASNMTDALDNGTYYLVALGDSASGLSDLIVKQDGSVDFGSYSTVATGTITAGGYGYVGGTLSDLTSADNGNYYALVVVDSANAFFGKQSGMITGIVDAPPTDAQTITFDNTGLGYGMMLANTETAAVPEPTSGLLMLVGLAGLALRRRRA